MVALEPLVESVRRVDWLSQFLLRLRPMEVRAILRLTNASDAKTEKSGRTGLVSHVLAP